MPSLEKSIKGNNSTNDSITAGSTKSDIQAKDEDSITVDEEQAISINEKEEPYTVFSKSKLIQLLIITSMTGMLSPLTGSIYFPSVNQIEADLGITTEQVNLTITVYMVLQATSPTFWGTLADNWGRRPVLLLTMVIYCGACIGLALSPNYAALMVFRMIQAFGSSSVIAISAGILSDIVQSKKRGSFYGFYSLGQSLGPVLGPVIGGIISEKLGWRWIFWILLILGCTIFICVGLFVPETLRSLVGNGSGYANPTPTQWLARRRGLLDEDQIAAKKTASNPRPKMNFLAPFSYFAEPDVFLILWLNGLVFTVFYCFMTSTTKQYSIHYPYLSELEIGICFLSMGVGTISGSFLKGRLLDYDYRSVSKEFKRDFPDKPDSEFPIFVARLRSLWINLILMEVATLIYGWMFIINAPLPVALVLQFLFAISASGIMTSSQTLLVDLFPGKGASITASNNLMRCLLGAMATAYIGPGIAGVGMGWMFTILGLILVANNVCLFILIKRGPQWRMNRTQRQNGSLAKSRSLFRCI
ncbi:major facilitator superfamily domain-containing protein [Mucor mucedo]|uniref:major facilitator superfamily domain-containing protein n=1 Tax=Mucor mucedo TaxID=29922 RepID=UPI0022200300|nr:major facilitator superfamily domain-containing protein [Mucor mucedo]KAI7864216.1 major facilitator superfamily domain-containing protein [Mucor mucedo]